MRRHQPLLGIRPLAANAGHRSVGVAPAIARFPRRELLQHIIRALARNGGDTGPALTRGAVATRARLHVQALPLLVGRWRRTWRRILEARIIFRHGEPFVHRQLARHGAHLRVRPQSFIVEAQLPHEVTGVETGQPRGEVAVAFAIDPVANRTGKIGASIAAGKGDDLSALTIARRPTGVGRAGGKQRQAGQAENDSHRRRNLRLGDAVPHDMKIGGRIIVVVAFAAMAACKPISRSSFELDEDAAKRGKSVAIQAQCAACHAMPGIDWPKGGLGPSLVNYGEGAMIAGVLPKQPDNLAKFIRNAPAYRPDSMMPAMDLSDRQARDLAHYLLMEGEK